MQTLISFILDPFHFGFALKQAIVRKWRKYKKITFGRMLCVQRQFEGHNQGKGWSYPAKVTKFEKFNSVFLFTIAIHLSFQLKETDILREEPPAISSACCVTSTSIITANKSGIIPVDTDNFEIFVKTLDLCNLNYKIYLYTMLKQSPTVISSVLCGLMHWFFIQKIIVNC